MSFNCPSVASKRFVSILNSDEGKEKGTSASHALANTLRPPSTCSSSSSTTTAVHSPAAGAYSTASESIGSHGTSLLGSLSGGSGGVSDATSVEPSPTLASQPSSWSSTKTAVEEPGVFLDKARVHPGLSSSPGPMSEKGRPAGLDSGFMATDTAPVSDPHHVRKLQSANGLQPQIALPFPQRMSVMTRPDSISETASVTDSNASSSNKKAKHSLVHGKRRYSCTYPGCDKTFSTSGHAARHNRIHTGQKPYRCNFPGCKASFSRQDNALAHFRNGHALAKASDGDDSLDAMEGHAEMSHDDRVDAGAEYGRKALEQGTAIAVVRDGKVERTVGLPKRRKNASESRDLSADYSASPSTSTPRTGPTPAAEYAQHRNTAVRPSAPQANRLLGRGLFGDHKPSSVHSDVNHRSHLPPLGPHTSAAVPRMHPYGHALSQHRTSLAEPFDDRLPANKHTSSENGADDAYMGTNPNSYRRFSQDVQPHTRFHERRASASRDSYLLPGTISVPNARAPYPMSQSSHSSVALNAPLAPRNWSDLRHDGLAADHGRSRQKSLASARLGGSPPHAAARSRMSSDTSSVRASSPEALLSLSSLSRPALPCSADRTTTGRGFAPGAYQPASPLDVGEGPIKLPPLKLPEA